MSPAVISAIASGLAVVIGALVTGWVQIQHNRTYHSQAGKPYPGGQPSPPGSPGSQP